MRVELWGGAFSADIPEDWEVVELDDVIEIELPEAAIHFSVFGRASEPPEPGEALSFVEAFLDGRATDEPIEYEVAEGVAAEGFFVDPGSRASRWDVGARVSSNRAVVYSYNDDGTQDFTRRRARSVFDSLHVA
jgi:hypothetical protein